MSFIISGFSLGPFVSLITSNVSFCLLITGTGRDRMLASLQRGTEE